MESVATPALEGGGEGASGVTAPAASPSERARTFRRGADAPSQTRLRTSGGRNPLADVVGGGKPS